MRSGSAASILSWWEESGVHSLVAETPRNWLSAPEPARVAEPAPLPFDPSPTAAAAEPALPDTIEAMREWLLIPAHLPGGAEGMPAVAPSGDPASGLMILIDMPSLDDLAAGQLLSGEAGALFDRMMEAIDRRRDQLYLASVAPFRPASGRFDPAAAPRFADIARHHVALARPRHLIVFGDNAARLLFEAPVPKLRNRWLTLESESAAVPTLVTIRPEKLLAQPALKRLAWEDLKMLKEEYKP